MTVDAPGTRRTRRRRRPPSPATGARRSHPLTIACGTLHASGGPISSGSSATRRVMDDSHSHHTLPTCHKPASEPCRLVLDGFGGLSVKGERSICDAVSSEPGSRLACAGRSPRGRLPSVFERRLGVAPLARRRVSGQCRYGAAFSRRLERILEIAWTFGLRGPRRMATGSERWRRPCLRRVCAVRAALPTRGMTTFRSTCRRLDVRRERGPRPFDGFRGDFVHTGASAPCGPEPSFSRCRADALRLLQPLAGDGANPRRPRARRMIGSQACLTAAPYPSMCHDRSGCLLPRRFDDRADDLARFRKREGLASSYW